MNLKLILPMLVAVAFSGCLSDEGGLTDFAQSPNCPAADFSWSEEVTFANSFGGGRITSGSTQWYDFATGEITGWNDKQASCVKTIRAEITWTNAPDEGADLYVSIMVPGTGVEVVGYDEQQLLFDGSHTETVIAPTSLDGFKGQQLNDSLRIGIKTDWASLSQSGLPVTLTITLGV